MSVTNLSNYTDLLATSCILEGINTNEFVVRRPYGGTNLLVCDTKNLITTINGTLDVSSFGISSLPNSIISTNSLGVFQSLGIGNNLTFASNTLENCILVELIAALNVFVLSDKPLPIEYYHYHWYSRLNLTHSLLM